MSEQIKTELLALQTTDPDGLLHAPRAVEWAEQHPTSALHAALEWDDKVAGREYRISQIRQLIRLHIVSDDGVPQLVSLSFDRKAGGGYRKISDVVGSKDMSEIMLADALAELERIQVKFSRVKELTAVWDQVEEVRTRRRRRSVAEQPAAQTA